MKSSKQITTIILASFAAIAAIVISFEVFSPLPAPPPRMSDNQKALAAGTKRQITLPSPDENLFLIRKLEMLYDSFPAGLDASSEEKRLRDIHSEAILLHQHIVSHGLDKDIGNLYTDFLSVWDKYVSFQAAIGRINSDAAVRLSEERINNSIETGWESGKLWAEMENNGQSTGDSMVSAALFGIASWFLSDYFESQGRNADQEAKVSAASTAYYNSTDPLFAKAHVTADDLASRYGWNRADAGFDETESEVKQINALRSRGDANGLIQIASDRMRARTHDPFAVINYVRCWLSFANRPAKPDDLLVLAEDAYTASELVPLGSIYDSDRRECLLLAAWNAIHAADEYAGNGFLRKDTELTRLCAAYADALADADPKDALGRSRFVRAMVCAHQGRNPEARKLIEDLRVYFRTDGYFYYVDARVHAVAGESNEAVESVKSALSFGFTEIRDARNSRDFSHLSKRGRDAIADLLKVKHSGRVIFGFFKDDIEITNLSAFPLTNVSVNPLIKKDGFSYSPNLTTIGRLDPSASYKWENVMSIPGSRYDSAEFKIVCDQL